MDTSLFSSCKLVQFLRSDPPRGLALARVIANKLGRRRPPSLDVEDVVQDAYVLMLEIADSLPADWKPPTASIEAYLTTRVVYALGDKHRTYWFEWQWCRRRWLAKDAPRGDAFNPIAASEGPTPFASEDALYDELVSVMPSHLRRPAFLFLHGWSQRRVWKEIGGKLDDVRLMPRQIAEILRRHDLWIDGIIKLTKRNRP